MNKKLSQRLRELGFVKITDFNYRNTKQNKTILRYASVNGEVVWVYGNPIIPKENEKVENLVQFNTLEEMTKYLEGA